MQPANPYVRPQGDILAGRLKEPRRVMQYVTGARQTGKSTLVAQVLERTGSPHLFASADVPSLRRMGWIEEQWHIARDLARADPGRGAVLVLDEVQKIPQWTSMVKHLWDADTRAQVPLKVVLVGSAPLLVGRGLTESMMGRFETIHLPHWGLREMRDAFGWGLEQHVFFGGYPGTGELAGDESRLVDHITRAVVEPAISQDILTLSRVDKPALLRRLVELGSVRTAEVVSFNRMRAILEDRGNAATMAHYLDLIRKAGLVAGLPKHTPHRLLARRSTPKLQALNNGLTAAMSGLTFAEARGNPEHWGRLVESAVGAHLAGAMSGRECEVSHWRHRNAEVDYVARFGLRLLAVEVRGGRRPEALPGLSAFAARNPGTRKLVVGDGGIPVEEFLLRPPGEWVEDLPADADAAFPPSGMAGPGKRRKKAKPKRRKAAA